MFVQIILAKWDKFISNFLRLSYDITNSDSGGHIYHFYSLLGPRILILSESGGVRILTGLYAVHHYYDEHDRLIRRISVRKEVKEKERMIVGDRKVYEAYNKSGVI